MTKPIETNDTVQTPNGPAVAFQEWYNLADPHGEYLIVRHPKKAEIDLDLCAQVFSNSNVSGWLVAYKAEEIMK